MSRPSTSTTFDFLKELNDDPNDDLNERESEISSTTFEDIDIEVEDFDDGDLQDFVEETEATTSISFDTVNGRDGTVWSTEPIDDNFIDVPTARFHRGRAKASSADPQISITPVTTWLRLFDNIMLEELVRGTNEKLRSFATKYAEHKRKHSIAFSQPLDKSHSTRYHQTDLKEIKAVIGILYMLGVYRMRQLSLDEIWVRDGTGVDWFYSVMSLDQFKILLRALRFDEKRTRTERLKEDKITHIRSLLTRFKENSKSSYELSRTVTVDEMLFRFMGRWSSKRKMKNKPAKEGILLYAVCDTETYYTFDLEVWVKEQHAGPYQKNFGTQEIVERLTSSIAGTGRNVTVDRLFTSLELGKSLKSKGLTLCGAVNTSKSFVPTEFVKDDARELYSSRFAFNKDAAMVSFKDKAKKLVLVLSTRKKDRHKEIIDEHERKLPKMIDFYNRTKVGVDIVDRMTAQYSTSRISRRWTLTFFFILLNISALNSYILHRDLAAPNNIFQKRKDYLKKLAFELAYDYAHSRLLVQQTPKEVKELIPKIFHTPSEQEAMVREGYEFRSRAARQQSSHSADSEQCCISGLQNLHIS